MDPGCCPANRKDACDPAFWKGLALAVVAEATACFRESLYGNPFSVAPTMSFTEKAEACFAC